MAKDWTGNGNSIYKSLGASNHSDKERVEDDFYATSPKAVDELLKYAELEIPNRIWEPSCGSGCLSERLMDYGREVVSTDLVDRGYGQGGVDFFTKKTMPEGCTAIITNPPYKFATQYVRHALKLLPEDGLLCLFLKTTFAEGKGRWKDIFSLQPPMYVLQCVERIICARNGNFGEEKGSAVSYAWWIWKKGWHGHTILDWINHQ